MLNRLAVALNEAPVLFLLLELFISGYNAKTIISGHACGSIVKLHF